MSRIFLNRGTLIVNLFMFCYYLLGSEKGYHGSRQAETVPIAGFVDKKHLQHDVVGIC